MILHFFLANRIIHEHGLHWTGIWSYKKRTISGRVLGNVKLANEWRFTTKATYLVIPELVNLTLWDRIALRYSFVVTFAASTGEGLELACKKYTTISEIYLKSNKPAAAMTAADILIRLTILSEHV
jgi:hypothetical protein